MIYATERLHNEGQRFNIWILGEGSLELQLRQKCLELGLMNIFSFLGFQKNPYPYIRCADALISCSMAEGLSMVIGEALILKTPIIATNCGGQSEALQGGKYGLLVENSTTGVYEGMKAFLTHEYTGNEIKCGDPNRFRPYELNHYIKRICELME